MDFILKAPRYFTNACIESINEHIINENKKIRRQQAQRVINEMKGK